MEEVREAIGITNRYSFFEYENFARPPLALRLDSLAQGKQQGVAFKNEISIDEFAKIEVRVGKVVEATNVEGSEKLIRLVVDFGRELKFATTRVIFTGVRGYGYTPEDFLNKQFFFITNLAPRKMPSYVMTPAGKMAEESQGMILAVDSSPPAGGSEQASKPLFISADGMPVGAKIR